jgi:hypothetical protein
MQYVLLIHAAEALYATITPAESEAIMQSYGVYSGDLFATGRAGDCAALQPSHTATSVRVREGQRTVKDGPYAETREQLGGYFTFRAETEEEALAWAARIPDAKGGTIEVRPLVEMGGPTAPAGPAKFTAATHKEYLLLIYDVAAAWGAMSEAERNAMLGRYMQFSKDLRAAGHFIAGEQLAPAEKSRNVSVGPDGKRVVRDGPFAETREQLGGYYRVWAKDLDEALALAARIPSAEIGTIEVRPIMDTSAYA